MANIECYTKLKNNMQLLYKQNNNNSKKYKCRIFFSALLLSELYCCCYASLQTTMLKLWPVVGLSTYID